MCLAGLFSCLQMRLDFIKTNKKCIVVIKIPSSSTVVLTWRPGAGLTDEEPGSGEPQSVQRCVCVLPLFPTRRPTQSNECRISDLSMGGGGGGQHCRLTARRFRG